MLPQHWRTWKLEGRVTGQVSGVVMYGGLGTRTQASGLPALHPLLEVSLTPTELEQTARLWVEIRSGCLGVSPAISFCLCHRRGEQSLPTAATWALGRSAGAARKPSSPS